MEYSNLFVCLMGMGTVFVGLTCLVFLVNAMGAVLRKTQKSEPAAASAPVAVQPQMDNAKKGELMAAIAAAIAEDMGTDISAVRIVSIKKV